MILHGSGVLSEHTELMFFSLGKFSLSNGSSENIFVLLFFEVDVIISVRMWVLSWIISIILPSRLRSQVSWVAEAPVLDV